MPSNNLLFILECFLSVFSFGGNGRDAGSKREIWRENYSLCFTCVDRNKPCTFQRSMLVLSTKFIHSFDAQYSELRKASKPRSEDKNQLIDRRMDQQNTDSGSSTLLQQQLAIDTPQGPARSPAFFQSSSVHWIKYAEATPVKFIKVSFENVLAFSQNKVIFETHMN